MSENDDSRIPATAILAKLILLRHGRELPEPERIQTWTFWVDVTLGSLNDFRAWRRALGLKGDETKVYNLGDGKVQHEATARGWQGTGWHIDIDVTVAGGERQSPIDDETATALEQIATTAAAVTS